MLMGVMDYPGWGHLTRHRGSPAVVGACYKCPIHGHRNGKKTIYLGDTLAVFFCKFHVFSLTSMLVAHASSQSGSW